MSQSQDIVSPRGVSENEVLLKLNLKDVFDEMLDPHERSEAVRESFRELALWGQPVINGENWDVEILGNGSQVLLMVGGAGGDEGSPMDVDDYVFEFLLEFLVQLTVKEFGYDFILQLFVVGILIKEVFA